MVVSKKQRLSFDEVKKMVQAHEDGGHGTGIGEAVRHFAS
jgi:hypothetical protein